MSAIRSTGMALLGLSTLVPSVQAQVGIWSGQAQVVLLARSAPQVSFAAVGQVRRIRQQGGMIDAAAVVRFKANTSYRLIVRPTGWSSSKVWVRTVDGEYRELTGGAALTVARQSRGDGEWEVNYRVEMSGSTPSATLALPVRYEIALDPVI
jgi:hypothetical protein